MRRLTLLFALLAQPLLAQPMLAQAVQAQDLASGAAIKAAISGNTVQGSMQASGAYTEFYAADGTIKGADYAGRWSVAGDQMCFAYGEDPAQCWGVRIAGAQIAWVGPGGDEGTGQLIAGNPQGF